MQQPYDDVKEHTPMTIALSHGGTTVYSSPAQSTEVLVGTTEGVATIARDGAGWRLWPGILSPSALAWSVE